MNTEFTTKIIIGSLLGIIMLFAMFAMFWEDIKNKPKTILIVIFILSLLMAYIIVRDRLTVKYGFWGEINFMGLIVVFIGIVAIILYLLFKSRRKS